MTKAKDIVMAYQKALGKGDMAGARTYLHDDLSFVGPFESFQRPEPYLEALGKLHHIVERVEPRRTFLVGEAKAFGGSISRIYRDIRFSPDKSPYKTHVGIHFWHDQATTPEHMAPGYFLHLESGESGVHSGV